MKRAIVFIGAAFLFITSNTHSMEWLTKWVSKSEKTTQIPDIGTMSVICKNLKDAYVLAQKAQEHASEIKHEILTYFANRPVFQGQSQNTKDINEKSKSVSFSENTLLNEFSGTDDADAYKPIIKVKTLPSWFFKAHLGIGLAGAVLILSGAGSMVVIMGGVNAALIKFYGIPLAVWSSMNIVAPGVGCYNTSYYATLLNKAIENNNMELIECLLVHNVDVNQAIVENIHKTHLYVTPLAPVQKALKDHNIAMANLFLRYDAAIDHTIFTKELLNDQGAFTCLLTTYLYRQAKVCDSKSKDFLDVAEDLDGLIHQLQPTEQAAFKNALVACSKAIVSHFEKMISYYENVRNTFDNNNLRKFEGINEDIPAMLAPVYNLNKMAYYNTGIIEENNPEEVKVVIPNPAIFVFDSKDANELLASLLEVIDLDLVKAVNRNQAQLEMALDYLLEQGAYINIYFPYHNCYITPLHKAILQGSMPCIEYFLSHNASPNMPTSEGKRPLEMAVEKNDADIVKLLLHNPSEPAAIELITQKYPDFYGKLKALIGTSILASALALQTINPRKI